MTNRTLELMGSFLRKTSKATALALLAIAALGIGPSANVFAQGAPSAASADVRWTATDDLDGSFLHVIDVLNQRLAQALTENDFVLSEERDLAFNHYQRFVQVVSGVPLRGRSIRIWTERGSSRTVQVEASLQVTTASTKLAQVLSTRGWSGARASQLRSALTPRQTLTLTQRIVRSHRDDPTFRGMTSKDEWVTTGSRTDLIRTVTVRGKRGTHTIEIDLATRKIVRTDYREFPQADIAAQVFPIYEEVESTGQILSRVPVMLKNINDARPIAVPDLYSSLKTQRYLYSKLDPVLAETTAGQMLGYWSPAQLKARAARIRAGLPLQSNDFASGVLLQGKYASINIHPDAITQYGPLSFGANPSSPLILNWIDTVVNGQPDYEVLPAQAFSGKPLYSADEALNRAAVRDPKHDPKRYIEDGFDELQVYYAVDTLMGELHARGFTDPELSTRRFDAFLFNPDVSYRDNAYYTDDTINFTTYSPTQPNMARDNPTIWHELGHGVMDRLMGDNIQLADTGGLSEGMADFVAAMVVQAVSHGVAFPGSNEFRIINKTGFHLTNEVHDDGESYGGAMKDFMDAVIAKKGEHGLDQVSDVVLEAMRLTRDHPGLTAADWFNHILFADSLGRPGLRAPGELAPYLTRSLAGRNFRFDAGALAEFSLVDLSDGHEVVGGSRAARDHEIPLKLAPTETAQLKIKASLKSSNEYAFEYPVEVRVQFNGGPLQGSVHWVGEEAGTRTYTLNSEADSVEIPLEVSGACDAVNRPDGSCSDFAYFQIWNNPKSGKASQPAAKKRFYVRVNNP